MASFSWNVRGFNKPSKHSVMSRWWQNNSLSFGCLLEIRVKERKAGKIVSDVFRDWEFMSNYEYNALGRIWVVWKSSVRLTPVFKSDQIITVSVKLQNMEEEFFCSFVYARNTIEERKKWWDNMCNHQDSSMFRGKPWIIMGDFNEVLEGCEHSGYENSPSISGGMRDFQRVTRHCCLTDNNYQGPCFTWCNKREAGLICKKLDRVLVNDVWLHQFSQAYSVFESGGCSDHLRSRTQIKQEEELKMRPFKFTNAIGKMPEFIKLLKEYWRKSPSLFFSTSAMHMLTKKLKAFKYPLRELSKKKLGDLPRRVKEAYEILCEKQKKTMENPTIEAIREETIAQRRWQRLADLEEEFYKQRSKLHWLNVEDLNTTVFHNAVKIREVRNAINELKGWDGEVIMGENIKKEAERYFTDFLTHKPLEFEGISVERLQDLLKFSCSEEEKGKLQKEVTGEEVRKVIFSMPAEKAPGPDGYTSEFFKASWGIIGSDVTVAIQSFFEKGFLPKGVNSTILALIPKKIRRRR